MFVDLLSRLNAERFEAASGRRTHPLFGTKLEENDFLAYNTSDDARLPASKLPAPVQKRRGLKMATTAIGMPPIIT